MNQYRAGIDIGSTTVKIVILDKNSNILFGAYRRHQANTLLKIKEKGVANALHEHWRSICKDSLTNPKTKYRYTQLCRDIVNAFDALPIDEEKQKPRVGVVGEILVKYMPLANNHIVDVLEREGAKAVNGFIAGEMVLLKY